MEPYSWTDRHPLLTAALASLGAAAYWYMRIGPQSMLQTARVAVLLAIPIGIAARTVRRARTMEPAAAREALRGAVLVALMVAFSFMVLL